MTIYDTANSIGNFFSNGYTRVANNNFMNHVLYTNINGIPYAAIGMTAIVAAVLGYATFQEGAGELASSISSGLSTVSEHIGDTYDYAKDSVSDAAETIAEKTSDITSDLADRFRSNNSVSAEPSSSIDKEYDESLFTRESDKDLEKEPTKLGGKRLSKKKSRGGSVSKSIRTTRTKQRKHKAEQNKQNKQNKQN